jgi:hypothetical protein
MASPCKKIHYSYLSRAYARGKPRGTISVDARHFGRGSPLHRRSSLPVQLQGLRVTPSAAHATILIRVESQEVGVQAAQASYSFRKYRQVPRAKAPGGFPLDAIQACGICVLARDSGNEVEFVASARGYFLSCTLYARLGEIPKGDARSAGTFQLIKSLGRSPSLVYFCVPR